jgi:hypothetical protein
LRDRDALKSNPLQSLLYFIELEGLDDCLDFFYATNCSVLPTSATTSAEAKSARSDR